MLTCDRDHNTRNMLSPRGELSGRGGACDAGSARRTRHTRRARRAHGGADADERPARGATRTGPGGVARAAAPMP